MLHMNFDVNRYFLFLSQFFWLGNFKTCHSPSTWHVTENLSKFDLKSQLMNVKKTFFPLLSMVVTLCCANNKTNRKFAAKNHVRLALNFLLRLIVSPSSSSTSSTPSHQFTSYKSGFYWFSLCCRGEKPIYFSLSFGTKCTVFVFWSM